MPTFQVTSPDGKTFRINAPEGATKEQALAYAQEQFKPAEAQKLINPTDDMSTTERTLAGVGKAFVDIGRGAGQLVGAVDRDDVAASRELDAALMDTTAGKVGNFAGNVAAFAPTAMIPGANTYTGAGVIGAGLGLLQPSVSNKETASNVGFGVAGGLFGKKIGDVLGKVLARRNARIDTARPVAQARAQQIADFQNEGYVIPPADVDAGFGSKAMNALSGQIKTQQKASTINQPVTNKMVAKDLGLDPDQPITREAIAGVRKQAGQAYEAVRGAGTVKADNQFKTALSELNKTNASAIRDFPELADTELQDLVKAANKDIFDADSAVDAISIFRSKADKYYAKGDKELGAAAKKIANEMESMLGRHLVKTGAPEDVLSNFQQARKLIAKTYTADKALNPSTGNINASKLGREIAKGRPLDGGMRKAGEFSQAFNKSAQEITNTNPYTIADAFVGVLGGVPTGGAATGAVLARPAVRSLILNPAYQKAFVRPEMAGPSLGVLLEGAERSAIPLSTLGALGLASEVSQ
jgi:hypothetical protein